MNLHLYPIHQAQRNQTLIIKAIQAIDAITKHHDLALQLHQRLNQIEQLINQPVTLQLKNTTQPINTNKSRKQGRD